MSDAHTIKALRLSLMDLDRQRTAIAGALEVLEGKPSRGRSVSAFRAKSSRISKAEHERRSAAQRARWDKAKNKRKARKPKKDATESKQEA